MATQLAGKLGNAYAEGKLGSPDYPADTDAQHREDAA